MGPLKLVGATTAGLHRILSAWLLSSFAASPGAPTCRAEFSAKTIARGYEAGIPALEEIIGDHFLVARLKLDMAKHKL